MKRSDFIRSGLMALAYIPLDKYIPKEETLTFFYEGFTFVYKPNDWRFTNPPKNLYSDYALFIPQGTADFADRPRYTYKATGDKEK